MLSLQSPHNSHNLYPKHQILQSAISPTFRNKRIPSANDHYSYSSNHNLKICRIQSPSKCSQKLKRRKSQYINSSSSYLDKNDLIPQKKKSSKSIKQLNLVNQSNPNNQPNLNMNNMISNTPCNKQTVNQLNLYPQNIINQMNCLKNQYKQLKLAYQQLIQQKINNSQKMAQIKIENRKLQAQLEIALTKINNSSHTNHMNSNNLNNHNNPTYHNNSKQHIPTSSSSQYIIPNQQLQLLKTQNQQLKQKNMFYQSQLDRIKKQCYKLLQAEKFKSKKLQQTIKDKDELLKLFTKSSFCQNQKYSTSFNLNSHQNVKSDMMNSMSYKNLLFSKQQIKSSSTPKHIPINNKFIQKDSKNIDISNVNIAQQSLFISQDKTIDNQSQFISISLTSVMQQSVCRTNQNVQLRSLPKQQPEKVRQPLIQIHFNQTQSTQTVLAKQPSSKRDKLSNRQQNIVHEPSTKQQQDNIVSNNMKKMRKQVHQKLQLNLNHFENKKQNILNLKTPMNGMDKKLMSKNKNSKSKKKQQQKQNNINYTYGPKDTSSQTNIIKISKKKQKNNSLTHK